MDAGDVYFLLDGGMTGNVGTLLKQFQTKHKVSKTFTVLKGLASVDKRHERVRGVGNVKQTETMLVEPEPDQPAARRVPKIHRRYER